MGRRRHLRVLGCGGLGGLLSAHPSGNDAAALDPLGGGAPGGGAVAARAAALVSLRARLPGGRRLHVQRRVRERRPVDRARGRRGRARPRARRARRRGGARGPGGRAADRGDGALDSADQPGRARDEAFRLRLLFDSPPAPAGARGPVSVRERLGDDQRRPLGLAPLPRPADGNLQHALLRRVRRDRGRRDVESEEEGSAVRARAPGRGPRGVGAAEPAVVGLERRRLLAAAAAQPGEARRGDRPGARDPRGARGRRLPGVAPAVPLAAASPAWSSRACRSARRSTGRRRRA